MNIKLNKYFLKLFILSISLFSIVFANNVYCYAEQDKISKETIEILSKVGQATAEIVDAVKPGVVNIATTRTIKTQGGFDPFFDDPFFRRFFGDRFKAPKERKSSGLGSGVIVDSNGYILTANHVVQGSEEIKVTLSDKREFKGKVVGSDAMSDIAVIKIEASNLPVVKMGDSSKLRVGETVLAIGSPYGLSQTVTMGIVSAVGRANVGIADYEDFIQTDAAINPGNSGGALVNVRGELVGINTAIFSTSGGYQGIGFAVPTSMAKAVMDSLINKGKVVRGWIGVAIQNLTPELAKQFNLSEDKGVLIGDVVEDGPADKAGLQRGDVIIEFDGKKIEDPNQLRNKVAVIEPGQEIGVKIIREGKTLEKKIIVGELPSEIHKPAKGAYDNSLNGVSVQNITPELIERLGLPKKIYGVIIEDIDEESPAYRVLKEGDIILEINRQKITSIKDYDKIVSKIKPGAEILLLIYRERTTIFITLSGD